MTKRDTRFKPGLSGNEAAKWKPGQSGNLAGKQVRAGRNGARRFEAARTQFEEAFNEALITQGGPEEAARLLREAARGKELGRSRNYAGGLRRKRSPCN